MNLFKQPDPFDNVCKYARRTANDTWEFGTIEREGDRKVHVKAGTAKTLEEAERRNGMSGGLESEC